MSFATDPVYLALNELRGERGRDAIAHAWRGWLEVDVAVDTTERWTAYRPRRRGHVVLDAQITMPEGQRTDQQILFVVDPPDSDGRPLGADRQHVGVLPPFRVHPWNATAWVIPHVPEPMRLAELLEDEVLADLLGTAPDEIHGTELIRYVPMRRSLIRTSARNRIHLVKNYGRGANLGRALDGLRAACGLPFAVPRITAVDAGRSTFAMSEVDGVELSSLFADPTHGPLALRATGEAMALLHGSDIELPGVRQARAEIDDLEDLLVADLAQLEPRLADQVQAITGRLGAELSNLAPTNHVPIHGKFMGDQVLVDTTTRQAGIVDWDDATCGDPHFDLGRLLAHLRFLGEERGDAVDVAPLLDGYRAAGGAIDLDRLRWHLAAGYLLRGKISLLRTLAPDWLERFRSLADHVEGMLDGAVDVVATEVSAPAMPR